MPQSLSTWVFEGEGHVFTGFGDSAQGLTLWGSLKRGLFWLLAIFSASPVTNASVDRQLSADEKDGSSAESVGISRNNLGALPEPELAHRFC